MTALPPMLLCWVPQTAKPAAFVPVGAKPPWNQPQLTFLALSRSPMFLPVATASGLVAVWLESEQWSEAGAVQRADAARVLDLGPARRVDRVSVAGPAGDQVERAGRGRAERGVPVV